MKRLPLLLALAVAAVTLAACGANTPKTVTQGESEAIYVTLGPMQYQVQVSRQLNQYEVGDRALLAGVAEAEKTLGTDDIWFGVWVRIFNGTDADHPAADQFKIVDTKGAEYEPVTVSEDNAFAYQPTTVRANDDYPQPGSAGAESPTTGALLLFKLPRQALDFRPLELEFSNSQIPGATSTVRLDV
ncbi:unannotated protein [freshwater metagenome]|uniref:Unannotated protein n=1 Tax=freshwater metagenome TaxID=449393 RepID=A0A6J7J3Z5_9ZZZZ|nr:hypothetical protein [Actinomycetota bacterium]